MVISAFPACGKSFYFKNNGRSLDSDSSNFQWLQGEDGSRIRNPEFPNNYIKHIKENMNNNNIDFIFVSSHEEVREAMQKENIPYVLVYPNSDLLAEWIGRCYLRGSTIAFIERLRENWDSWVETCHKDEYADFKVELQSGQYLSEYLDFIKKGSS